MPVTDLREYPVVFSDEDASLRCPMCDWLGSSNAVHDDARRGLGSSTGIGALLPVTGQGHVAPGILGESRCACKQR
jgi:hypothetical protein